MAETSPRSFYPEAVTQSDRRFAETIYTKDTRDYYNQLLDAVLGHLSQENPKQEVELIKRPSGLSVGYFGADSSQANGLPDGQAMVVFGHGSLAVSQKYRTGWGNPKDQELVYYDPAKTRFGDSVRGIDKKTLAKLQKMKAIDITAKDKKEEQIAIDVLKHIGEKVDQYMCSGITIERSSDILHHLCASHMQCGGQGGSMLSTLTEFVKYANLVVQTEQTGKLIPAIELAEGMIISLDIGLLRQGKASLKLYDQESFLKHIQQYDLTIGAEGHCVDDRVPYFTTSKTAKSQLAKRASGYNKERKRHDPKIEARRESGQLQGPHHAAIVALCDSNNPSDRALAADVLTTETQVMCGSCVGGYFPKSMGDWKDNPTDHELMNNTSAALVFNAPAEVIVDSFGNQAAVYNTIGAGASKNFSLVGWEGSHLFTRRALTGVIVGCGELQETTLVRPPLEHGIERVAPIILVTESVIRAAGGIDEFIGRMGVERNYYSAIALVDPDSRTSQLVYLNNAYPQIDDEASHWLGGFFHSDRPQAIMDVLYQQESALLRSRGKVQFTS